MDEKIIRLLQGRLTSEEVKRLRASRSSSSEEEPELRELAEIWAAMAEPDLETTPPPPSVIRERAAASAPISLQARQKSRTRRILPILMAAASIAIILAGIRLFLGASGPMLQIQELATGPTETLMTELSDGTTVFLAPESSLRVSSARGVREVHLTGKAFFGVASHGGEWPFVVRSERGSVQVLGTRFEYSTEGETPRVVVLDGAVDFSSLGERVQLRGGQMGFIGEGAQPTLVEVEDADNLLSWMGNSLVFHETPLSQAAREVGNRFGAVVEVIGEGLAGQTVTGGFNNRSFAEIIAVICRVVDAECVIGDTHAIISARDYLADRSGVAPGER